MNQDRRELICRTMIDKIWNDVDLDMIDAFFAPDAVHHELEAVDGGLGCTNGLLGQFVDLYHRGFPDLHISILDQTCDGDSVITHWRAEGTQTGPLLTIAPNGRHMEVEGTRIDRFEDERIVETWDHWNVDAMLEQIGLGQPEREPVAVAVS